MEQKRTTTIKTMSDATRDDDTVRSRAIVTSIVHGLNDNTVSDSTVRENIPNESFECTIAKICKIDGKWRGSTVLSYTASKGVQGPERSSRFNIITTPPDSTEPQNKVLDVIRSSPKRDDFCLKRGGRSKSNEAELSVASTGKTRCHVDGNSSTVCSGYTAEGEKSSMTRSLVGRECSRKKLLDRDHYGHWHDLGDCLPQQQRQKNQL